MREIKFRSWDKKEKVMSLGNILNIFFTPYTCQFAFMKDEKINTVVRCIEDVELLQYTGLKDKNGKEIYEGDIVKHYDVPPFGVVYYDEKLGAFMLDWKFEYEPNYFNDCDKYQIEVIGNIYENPELLEVI